VYPLTLHAVGVGGSVDVETSVRVEITADVVILTGVITLLNVQNLGATILAADVADLRAMVQPSSASKTCVLRTILATSLLDLNKVLPFRLQFLASVSSFQDSHDLLHSKRPRSQ